MKNKTSVQNDEERKADMMEQTDRKGERKEREHEQPLAMNLDKERRPTMRMKSLFCLSLLYEKENENSKNNIESFLGKEEKKKKMMHNFIVNASSHTANLKNIGRWIISLLLFYQYRKSFNLIFHTNEFKEKINS